ncbi:MAG: ArsR family transcriptional regulator [Chloroflexota bacterium]
MESVAQPLGFLKVISHEVRWHMLTLLAHSDYKVQELVSLLEHPQNLVSYHLKQLRDIKLVQERRSTADARDIYYRLDLEQLKTYYLQIGQTLHPILVDTSAHPMAVENETPARILFVCTENSARSQMAEGILRHLGGGWVKVTSAGIQPSRVHPNAIRVLAAMGIDISQQRSKHLDVFQDHAFDYFITVCDRARETCPAFPNIANIIHWSLPDPAAVEDHDNAQYQAFEDIAQQLFVRTQHLLTSIAYTKEVVQ